jgi:RNA polymerase sigma-70 factor (ECF subfamily)
MRLQTLVEERPEADEAISEVASLVHAAQAGDQSAFSELYRRYSGMVRSIALSRLPPDQSSDVVQEVFLRVLRTLKTLRAADAFGTWLGTIARHVVADAERQHRAITGQDQEPLGPETQDEEMRAEAARHAIALLPAAYRDTMSLRLIEGLTSREIAGRTGLTAGSVRVNLHRGMKLLRQRLTAPSKKR